jgi:hypothetical protein
MIWCAWVLSELLVSLSAGVTLSFAASAHSFLHGRVVGNHLPREVFDLLVLGF